ncbi:MAG: hypothetical protein HQK77_19775 [Desulfobacterales bacterium]|nr:hypothetical protein [Desulfobacterales bacterium]
MENSEHHFMAHHELSPYYQKVFHTLISESDRGAVLLGVSLIDEHLTMLFEKILPESVSGKRQKEIFNFTGPFGSLASKLDIALVCRLLPIEIVTAIHKIRKIRNAVAHQTISLNLKEYQAQLYEIFTLMGTNVNDSISRMTKEMILKDTLNILTVMEHPTEDGNPLFEGKADAIEYLSKNGKVLKVLEEKRPRWELALGVGLICGMILLYRDEVIETLGCNKTIIGALYEAKEFGMKHQRQRVADELPPNQQNGADCA